MIKIILASKSPRRKEILEKKGYQIEVVDSLFNEDKIQEKIKKPYELVERLALEKASKVSKDYPDAIVIGSDTVVSYKKNIFGKPKDGKEAYNILKKLNGKTHSVFTGVCIIYQDIRLVFHEESFVTFKKNTDKEILLYIKTGECFDKAGSYAIQGEGNKLISNYTGSFENIMGLPIDKVHTIIQDIINN